MNLILLPTHGVVSAAWSTLATFMVGALLSWILGRSLFTLPSLGKDFWASAFATATMLFVLNLLPSTSGTIWLLFKIATSIVTYAALAWALDVAGFRRLVKL